MLVRSIPLALGEISQHLSQGNFVTLSFIEWRMLKLLLFLDLAALCTLVGVIAATVYIP